MTISAQQLVAIQEARLQSERLSIFRFLFDKERIGQMRAVLETGQVGLLQIWSPDKAIAPLLILSPGNPHVGCVVPISNADGEHKCHATHVTMMALLTALGSEVFYGDWQENASAKNLTRQVAATFEWKLFDPDRPPKTKLKSLAAHLCYGVPDYPEHLMGLDLDFAYAQPILPL